MIRIILIVVTVALLAGQALSQDIESSLIDSVSRALEANQDSLLLSYSLGETGYRQDKWSWRSGGSSTICTVAPVIVGVLWWKFDDPDSVHEYYSGWSQTYVKNPDRTGPVALILSGIIIGPSIGYFACGKVEQGVNGIVIRSLISSSSFLLGVKLGSIRGGIFTMMIGSVVTIGFAIKDIVSVDDPVQKNDKDISCSAAPSLRIAPAYFADSGAAGLQLNLNF